MRHVKFNNDDTIEVDVQIESLGHLSIVLEKATYADWLEGLGMPSCNNDLCMWHKMGQFLKAYLDLEAKKQKAEA